MGPPALDGALVSPRLAAARRPALIGLAYLVLALVILGPTSLAPGRAMVGYPTVDAHDTALLRGLLGELLLRPWDWPQSTGVYYPAGLPLLHFAPNLLDHALGVLPSLLLPFPYDDNLWWLGALVALGLAGHRLGEALGGLGGGFVAGVGLLMSEPLLREANLHHAPQVLFCFAPLALLALLRAADDPGLGQSRRAGAFVSLLSLAYWYFGLFFVLGALPLWLRLGLRRLGAMALVGALVCGPFLLPQLLAWGDRPLTRGVSAPPPREAHESYAAIADADVFTATHGATLDWPWRPTPADLSNQVSLALVVAALLGARGAPRRLQLGAASLVLLGGVQILGPYLRQGEGLFLVDGGALTLPFGWLRGLHPLFARLTWPERWGLLVPLGLVLLAARAPRAGLFAVAVLVEMGLRSANFPLRSTDLSGQLCWGALKGATGALIELPFAGRGLRASGVGLHQRQHGRPLVNAILLPPGATPPAAWTTWLEASPGMRYLRAWEAGEQPADPGPAAILGLQRDGISAITVDVEPSPWATEGVLNRYRSGLGRHLGAPIDLGCALVWWFDPSAPAPKAHPNPDRWRLARSRSLPTELPLDTLIEPLGSGEGAAR
jgi:hypothetical protein